VDRPGFAPGSPACKAGVLLLDDATHYGGVCRIRTGVAWITVRHPATGRTSPHKLRRKDSNLRTPIPKIGVCTSTNYPAPHGAAARTQTSNRAFRRRPRCSLAPRRRMVHLAGLEPAHAPGLSRLPLPIGLQMHWSGTQPFTGAARRPRTGSPLFTGQMHVHLCLSGTGDAGGI